MERELARLALEFMVISVASLRSLLSLEMEISSIEKDEEGDGCNQASIPVMRTLWEDLLFDFLLPDERE